MSLKSSLFRVYFNLKFVQSIKKYYLRRLILENYSQK